MTTRSQVALWLAATGVIVAGCGGSLGTSTQAPPDGALQNVDISHPDLSESFPRSPASAAFRSLWYDGNAELSGYRATIPRYGELRSGELVLVYVTEPMDRRTWIKDDHAPAGRRLDVLKLNVSLKFLTGLYPYSVMTSIFSPIDDWGGERFAPTKITLSAQEWCGHVFHGLWLAHGWMDSRMQSYFTDEGEQRLYRKVPPGTLYEDALLIQLRELDGPFAEGGDWSGSLVPSLWRLRRAHEPPAPAAATITRSTVAITPSGTTTGDESFTRFVLTSGDYRRTIDVEQAPPHRVLGWTTSDGEDVRLLRTARLPYWKLNHAGDESYREQLGLSIDASETRPVAPEGTIRVGR